MTTTFVVTGRHRSGTSMMMRALANASNITPEYNPELDAQLKELHADTENYHPNPNGYYLADMGVRPDAVPGKLIKVSTRTLDWFNTEPGDYLVAHIVRNEAERLASWKRAFGYHEKAGYDEVYARVEAYLLERDDCRVCHVSYADVLANPLEQFQRLVTLGWPIDPVVAAGLVDDTLYRNRLDEDS